jgi:acetyl esterase/lipase
MLWVSFIKKVGLLIGLAMVITSIVGIIRILTIYDNSDPLQFTFKEEATIFLWKDIIPAIVSVGGRAFPDGRVVEFSYGDQSEEKIDVIQPLANSKEKGAVVHIHGGAWLAGSKGSFYSRPLLKFSEAGYLIFSINYPLAPNQQHPHLLVSPLKALSWIKNKYPDYQIHLIGDSAGGNLAMMLGVYISNPEKLNLLGHFRSESFPKIQSIVNIYGVNDRVSWIEDGFPSAKLFSKVYFENTITPNIPVVPTDFDAIPNLPPTFIVGAGQDALLRSSKILAEKLKLQNKIMTFKIYENSAHGFFSFGEGCDELSRDMLQFFDKQRQREVKTSNDTL